MMTAKYTRLSCWKLRPVDLTSVAGSWLPGSVCLRLRCLLMGDPGSMDLGYSWVISAVVVSSYVTLGIKTAQRPYAVWSLGPKALIYESLDS